MKVLFAVSNENISSLIVKKYQKEYKEIISYKNVYYFNAILKEIQKDKTYDRIVISEDLEQFTNSNYQQMDKFIFDRLDSITDEASNMQGENIPIILLCAERRTKGEEILVKLFGIGIYDAILGKDRSIDEVCNLINRPRSKKEAKEYYRIDSDDVNYQAESENDVTEVEIQNILAHYKRIGKNEEKYVESFDNIALQYNDIQLKIICKFLPLNVRAVLEEKSPKYQQLMSFNKSISGGVKNVSKAKKEMTGTSERLLTSPTSKTILSKPVVIPSNIKTDSVKKLTRVPNTPKQEIKNNKINNDIEEMFKELDITEETTQENIDQKQPSETPKRGRGRPKKIVPIEEQTNIEAPKRGRGRPKKVKEELVESPKEEKVQSSVLPGFDNEEDEQFTYADADYNRESKETILPGFDDEQIEEKSLPGFNDEEMEDELLPGVEHKDEYKHQDSNFYANNKDSLQISKDNESNLKISDLLTRDKKIVTFVGTSKNGTSFILNNLAELISSQGIDVAILDTTRNKNSYYIYTKNDENLRKIAFQSITNLVNGEARGIKVNNNLTVYTSLPGEDENITKVQPILETLLSNHTVILIDCDFETPIEYFSNAQEIYLVQSMDVLTIQPLTAFLRELKAKDALKESKIRIIINKYVKLKNVTEKAIIGGVSFYNDPAMSYMTELFNRNTVKYITVPFEEDIYARYLEGLVNCDITLKGYSKVFMQTLKQLSNSVYPLISDKGTYTPPNTGRYKSGFSANMKSTLEQMKRNY